MSGSQWMVVLIVALVVIGRLISRGMGYPGWGSERRGSRVAGGDEVRLREEVRALNERLSVLERIATDDSRRLDREIEALRERPGRLDGRSRHDAAGL